MNEQIRLLHLLGATGTIRTAKHEGRDHLVVPVVALVEGVIHAVNAPNPEYVSREAMAVAPSGWDGRPIMMGHPARNGRQISANSPSVLEAESFGRVFNTRLEGNRLLMDAYIDVEKAEKVGATRMLERIKNGDMVEVSVGAYVTTEAVTGTHNGRNYTARWKGIFPDHLAFLENKKGACSCEMGCGVPRIAMMVTAEADAELEEVQIEEPANDGDPIVILGGKGSGNFGHKGRPGDAQYFGTPEGQSLDERLSCVNAAVSKKFLSPSTPVAASPNFVYARRVYDGYVIVQKNDELLKIPYVVKDGEVEFTSEPTEVVMTSVPKPAEPAESGELKSAGEDTDMKKCKDCGAEFTGDGELCADCAKKAAREPEAAEMKKCTDCGEEMKDGGENDLLCAACKSKKSSKTMESVTPPPRAAAANLKAACRCEGGSMFTAEQKKAVITALVENKHSGFTKGDEAILEAASDERLEAFRVATEAREKSELKAAEAAKPRQLSAEEFMAVAPPELKSLISKTQAAETARKSDLVSALKACQTEYSETELSGMSLDSLERLGRLARLEEPAENFIGRNVPSGSRFASDKEDPLTPPDPYAEGLKALAARQ